MSDNLFGDLKVTITCNQCGQDFQQEVAGFENERPFFCPNCGHRHAFRKETYEHVIKNLDDANKDLKELVKNFKFGS